MRLLALFAVLAFLIDQISKYVVIHVWQLWRIREIDVLPPILNFRYGENRGINFGLGDGISVWVLIVLAVVISLGVLVWAYRAKLNRISMISAGLLIGGALANVLDRLIYGYVLDFLNNSCCGFDNPFVYNLADVFIFAGAIGLIFFGEDAEKATKKAAKKPK
ncbi:signal peptidase II [Marimonas sp. MJW-29]|uniref:Lipoprotein signal peptidase n=1 Tax=Sulfitobacter sediminis TaxID=3234186 RepID=A0ABV3RLV0_9RHOB